MLSDQSYCPYYDHGKYISAIWTKSRHKNLLDDIMTYKLTAIPRVVRILKTGYAVLTRLKKGLAEHKFYWL